jgi:hypothetical protein
MAEARGGGAKPAWAPPSWRPKDPAAAEELDVDPRELARRIRLHRDGGGEGLIDFDEPADAAAESRAEPDAQIPGGTRYSTG